MNQLRVGFSRLVCRPLVFPVNQLNLSGKKLPACQRAKLDLQSYVSSNFNTYTSAFAEVSPNNSGSSKPEEEQKPREAESEVETQLRAELSKALNEVKTLKTKTADLEDKYLRTLADMENLRTRMTKQISDAKLYATQSFCKDLADIEDILQLAINSVPKEEIKESNKHLKALYEGLVMTEQRLLQVFKTHGLTQINPLNSKFNPNEHEAVFQKEEEGKESGTVILVSKIGYKLHDRVIRPAVVGVAK